MIRYLGATWRIGKGRKICYCFQTHAVELQSTEHAHLIHDPTPPCLCLDKSRCSPPSAVPRRAFAFAAARLMLS